MEAEVGGELRVKSGRKKFLLGRHDGSVLELASG